MVLLAQVPNGSDGDGDDGTISLGGEGHADHLAHPAAEDDEYGLFSLSSPLQWFVRASMN